MCYDAVTFDDDGVLTKPTLLEARWEAVRRAFDEFDAEPTTETVDGVINGGFTCPRRICAVHDVPVDDFWSHHETHVTATRRACLENGTKPLCDNVVIFDDIDHSLAVVSNNQHVTIKHILDVFDIGDRFEVVYGHDLTVEGVRVKRPDPHHVERATDELGVDSALHVGDSNVDVVAADRAGINSVFIHRSYHDGYQLVVELTYELDSLDELLVVC